MPFWERQRKNLRSYLPLFLSLPNCRNLRFLLTVRRNAQRYKLPTSALLMPRKQLLIDLTFKPSKCAVSAITVHGHHLNITLEYSQSIHRYGKEYRFIVNNMLFIYELLPFFFFTALSSKQRNHASIPRDFSSREFPYIELSRFALTPHLNLRAIWRKSICVVAVSVQKSVRNLRNVIRNRAGAANAA